MMGSEAFKHPRKLMHDVQAYIQHWKFSTASFLQDAGDTPVPATCTIEASVLPTAKGLAE